MPPYNCTIKANDFKALIDNVKSVLTLLLQVLSGHCPSAHFVTRSSEHTEHSEAQKHCGLPGVVSLIHPSLLSPCPHTQVQTCSSDPGSWSQHPVHHTQLTFSFTVSRLSVQVSSECSFPSVTMEQSLPVGSASSCEFLFWPAWSSLDL